eukprot:COSAG01_NODE_1398_length_10466_cov_173.518086_16_plen_129_part_00
MPSLEAFAALHSDRRKLLEYVLSTAGRYATIVWPRVDLSVTDATVIRGHQLDLDKVTIMCHTQLASSPQSGGSVAAIIVEFRCARMRPRRRRWCKQDKMCECLGRSMWMQCWLRWATRQSKERSAWWT